ncbi:MAG: hypothetical protein LBL87_01140 [Ruminococcus sp.]|jgi:hypothetical protein|nr:hypothetical protein [Ruminococcus sp.]
MSKEKNDKQKLIMLQNILFDTNERQLMASPQFVLDCAKKYALKHLKAVATFMNNIKVTKTPAMFFGSLEPLMSHLEALKKIENLYPLQKPLPSEFIKDFEINKPLYMNNLIKRFWHEVKLKVPPGGVDSPFVRAYFQKSMDELMHYKEYFQEDQIQLVNVYYSAIFKRDYGSPPTAEELIAEQDFGMPESTDTEEPNE